MTILRRFFDALNEEEAKFVPSLAADSLGMMLRSAISELDWYHYNLVRADPPTNEQQEQFYILQLGVTRLVKLALDARASYDVPVVTFRRCRDVTIPVLEIASALGMIQHGRRVAQTIALGVGRIEESSEKHFVITLPEQIADDAYYERAVLQHYNAESRRQFAAATGSEKWKQLEARVNAKLSELVYPFKEHFIGYGGDPLLDEYFFGLAYHEINLQEGFDTFHYSIRFGGIRFQNYVLALTFLISIAMKHERFAEALVKKEHTVLLENLLTISVDREPFIQSIRDAVNWFGKDIADFEQIGLAQARSIFEVLSCGRASTSLVDAPGSPLPLILQFSDAGFIRCQTGAYSEPVRFLLGSLRYHYPREYDANQHSREASFQRAIRRVLNGAFRGLQYRENVTVKLGSRKLTDVDVAILEETTGVVVLCQLKHQELCGADLHARRVRGDRLKGEVKDWLGKLGQWIAVVGEKGIRASLRVPRRFPELAVYKLVISRHDGYPLRDVIADSETFYANWIQFFNANELVKRDCPERKLQNLLGILRKVQNPPESQTHLPEPTTNWTIDELSFVTRQEDDRKDAAENSVHAAEQA